MEAVLAKSDKTIVEPSGTVPYLPLPTARRAPEVQAAPQPQVQTGAGQCTP